MTQPEAPFDDIDALVSRITALAQQLDAEHAAENPAAPPPFAYRRSLGELAASASRQQPDTAPALAEVFSPQETDEVFLSRAYQQLLGRAPDESGFAGYLSQLPKAGRLYVLADLLCAEETQASLARRNREARWQRQLARPLRLAHRLGPLKRPARRLLKPAYRLAAVLMRPRLRLWDRLEQLERHGYRHQRLVRDILLELDGELGRLQAGVQREQAAYWSALQHHRRAIERLVEQPEAVVDTPAAAEGLAQSLFDAYYLAFEDACRGSEDDIRAHLQQYRPQWEAALRVGRQAVDLGCGRGEWLALLAEEGFDVHGVDTSIAMTEHCRERGFSVTQTDAVTALRQLEDNSQALVSAFHLAEHLPFETLYALVDEARRVLVPGGVLILETPNPENVLVGSHTFYHDPTHRNPLTPTAMEFLLGYHGYADVIIRRFNPYPEDARVPGDDPLTERINGHLCGPQDFAAIGLKAAPIEGEDEQERQVSFDQARQGEGRA